MYVEVMDGVRNDEGFMPHHRIAAARELIKRGFDETVTPASEAEPTTESSELTTENCELITDDSELTEEYLESEENMAAVIEIIKRTAEQVTPEEREEHEAAWRNKDLSMWEIIAAQPPPVITKEHARIGAAAFREAIERWRQWDESNVKIPDPPKGLTQYNSL